MNGIVKPCYEIIENTPALILVRDARLDSQLIAVDAEKVVEELFAAYGNKSIFYMDSFGEIHQLKHDRGKFSGFTVEANRLPVNQKQEGEYSEQT